MAIGNVIIELRAERNISQQRLADLIGVSQSTIAQIEKNRNEATASTIRKLAAFFNVSANYLLELEDDFGTPTVAPMGESLTHSERELLLYFRQLSPYLQGIASNTVRGLTGAGASDLHKKA